MRLKIAVSVVRSRPWAPRILFLSQFGELQDSFQLIDLVVRVKREVDVREPQIMPASCARADITKMSRPLLTPSRKWSVHRSIDVDLRGERGAILIASARPPILLSASSR